MTGSETETREHAKFLVGSAFGLGLGLCGNLLASGSTLIGMSWGWSPRAYGLVQLVMGIVGIAVFMRMAKKWIGYAHPVPEQNVEPGEPL